MTHCVFGLWGRAERDPFRDRIPRGYASHFGKTSDGPQFSWCAVRSAFLQRQARQTHGSVPAFAWPWTTPRSYDGSITRCVSGCR